jgi:hypothetical protein
MVKEREEGKEGRNEKTLEVQDGRQKRRRGNVEKAVCKGNWKNGRIAWVKEGGMEGRSENDRKAGS